MVSSAQGKSRPPPALYHFTAAPSCRGWRLLEDRTLPSTFTVLNLNDSGPGSLRAEVAAANANLGADTIAFANGLSGTIRLTSGELLITDSVAINGPGADQLSVSGNNASRVFETACLRPET